jgi:hypothetical protein
LFLDHDRIGNAVRIAASMLGHSEAQPASTGHSGASVHSDIEPS